MRISSLIGCLLVGCCIAGCASRSHCPAAASSWNSCIFEASPETYTRLQLQARARGFPNAIYYYIGTRDGLDCVAESTEKHLEQGGIIFPMPVGEISVDHRHDFTADYSAWQVIDLKRE